MHKTTHKIVYLLGILFPNTVYAIRKGSVIQISPSSVVAAVPVNDIPYRIDHLYTPALPNVPADEEYSAQKITAGVGIGVGKDLAGRPGGERGAGDIEGSVGTQSGERGDSDLQADGVVGVGEGADGGRRRGLTPPQHADVSAVAPKRVQKIPTGSERRRKDPIQEIIEQGKVVTANRMGRGSTAVNDVSGDSSLYGASNSSSSAHSSGSEDADELGSQSPAMYMSPEVKSLLGGMGRSDPSILKEDIIVPDLTFLSFIQPDMTNFFPCPIGYELVGDRTEEHICKLKKGYQIGPCGFEYRFASDEITTLQALLKESIKCRVSWPLNSFVNADFSYPCPKGWDVSVEESRCVTQGREERCEGKWLPLQANVAERQYFAFICEVSWPTYSESCPRDYTQACPDGYNINMGKCRAIIASNLNRENGDCGVFKSDLDINAKIKYTDTCRVSWPCK